MILCRLTVTQVQCGTFELAERQDNLLRRGRRERGEKKKMNAMMQSQLFVL